MRKAWTPPCPWVFGVATGLGLFSTLQAYPADRPQHQRGHAASSRQALILNLALWYIPALLTPSIVALARRFRLDAGRRLRALAVHVAAALFFSVVHFVGMVGVRFLLWSDGGGRPPGMTSWPRSSSASSSTISTGS